MCSLFDYLAALAAKGCHQVIKKRTCKRVGNARLLSMAVATVIVRVYVTTCELAQLELENLVNQAHQPKAGTSLVT